MSNFYADFCGFNLLLIAYPYAPVAAHHSKSDTPDFQMIKIGRGKANVFA